jgi:hypothetical protein
MACGAGKGFSRGTLYLVERRGIVKSKASRTLSSNVAFRVPP